MAISILTLTLIRCETYAYTHTHADALAYAFTVTLVINSWHVKYDETCQKVSKRYNIYSVKVCLNFCCQCKYVCCLCVWVVLLLSSFIKGLVYVCMLVFIKNSERCNLGFMFSCFLCFWIRTHISLTTFIFFFFSSCIACRCSTEHISIYDMLNMSQYTI